MNNFDKIDFLGQGYLIRYLASIHFGNVIVSSLLLNNALFDQLGQYISDEAKQIDEKIFFYIEDDLMCLSSEELDSFLLESRTGTSIS